MSAGKALSTRQFYTGPDRRNDGKKNAGMYAHLSARPDKVFHPGARTLGRTYEEWWETHPDLPYDGSEQHG